MTNKSDLFKENGLDFFGTGGAAPATSTIQSPQNTEEMNGADVFATGGGGAPASSSNQYLGKIGAYNVLRPLGVGGMGYVYLVEADNGYHYALKALHPKFGGDTQARQNFEQEFRTQGHLDHPQIVKVHEYGIDPDTELPFYTMDYLNGQTLEERLSGPKMTLIEIEGFIKKLCEAVMYIHEMDVVHRDLKPGNIMLVGDEVVLFDFGIAKMQGGTLHTEFVGSAYYMASEQLSGSAEVLPAADVFSIGVITYQLLAGCPPTGVIDPPSKRGLYELSEAADGVIMRAMQQNINTRYSTVEDFLRDLVSSFGIKPFEEVFFTWTPEPGNPAHQVVYGPVLNSEENIFYFINAERRVVAVEIETGEVKWYGATETYWNFTDLEFDIKQKRITTDVVPLSLNDGSAIECTFREFLHLGNRLSYRSMGIDRMPNELWVKEGVFWPEHGKPLVYGDKIFYSEGNYLVALRESDGKELWRFKVNYKLKPKVVHDQLIVTGTDGTLYALSVETGEVNWQEKRIMPTTKSAAIGANMIHVGPVRGNTITSLDLASGNTLFSFNAPSRPVSRISEDAGKIVFAAEDGTVYGIC